MIQNFWQNYGTIIIGFLGTGVGAAIMAFVARFVADMVSKKVFRSLDVKKIIEEVTEKVTSNIVGNVIDVDLSSYVNQAVSEHIGKVMASADDTKNTVNEMRTCLSLIAKAVSKSRLLDEGEQKLLFGAAESLEGSSLRAQKPVLKVELEKAETEQTNEAQKKPEGLNFEGVE